jgi:hypothetical protein
MLALKPRARLAHRLERTWALIDAPFPGAADKAGRNINCLTVLLVPKPVVSADPKIAEPSLEARPCELRCWRQDNNA